MKQDEGSKAAYETTKEPNLLRAISSGRYYGRFSVAGKLNWLNLQTDSFAVARLRLADERSKIQRMRLAYSNVTAGTATVGELVSLPPTSQNLIDGKTAATATDTNANRGGMPGGLTSHAGVFAARAMPFDKAAMLPAQKPVVAMALEAAPPEPAFGAALKELKAIHKDYRRHVNEVDNLTIAHVKIAYRQLVEEKGARLIAGDPTVLDDLENEQDVANRFDAERHTREHAGKTLAHAQVAPALVVRDGIDAALAKLAAGLEARAAAEYKKFGIPLEYSGTTRLVQSVRLQFTMRTHDLTRMARMQPEEMRNGAFAKTMFGDFLDLAAW